MYISMGEREKEEIEEAMSEQHAESPFNTMG